MSNDIILITGGEGNIAESIIKRYLEAGDKVIATDIYEKSSHTEFYDNPNYEYYKLDVTNVEEMKEIYTTIQNKYGRLTHVISAAGGPVKTEIEGGIETVTYEDINKSIELNLTSHIYITKVFMPLLEEEKSKNKTITLISSVNALKTFNLPIYSAAKSGIYGLMKSLVRDFGQKGIRINTVSPGTVPTKADIASNGNFYNYRYKDMMALGDFTKPEDIADAIYSVTNIMKAVTGQNIVVDSGQIS